MTPSPIPDYPLAERQRWASMTIAGVGVAAAILQTALAAQPQVALISASATVVLSVIMIKPMGRLTLRMLKLDDIEVVEAPQPRRATDAARAAGLRAGVLGGVAAIAGVHLVSAVLGDNAVSAVAGPVLILVGGINWAVARSMRRWEEQRGRVLHLRVGGRHLTWTRQQARDQLVSLDTGSPPSSP